MSTVTKSQMWTIVKRSNHVARFSLTDPGTTSGWYVVLTVRAMDGTLLFQASTLDNTISFVAVDLNAGIYDLTLTATQTAAFDEGKYKWDVWRTNGGFEKQLAYGIMEVVPQVRIAG